MDHHHSKLMLHYLSYYKESNKWKATIYRSVSTYKCQHTLESTVHVTSRSTPNKTGASTWQYEPINIPGNATRPPVDVSARTGDPTVYADGVSSSVCIFWNNCG